MRKWNYGVVVNFAPSGKQKGVTLHKSPCPYYRMNPRSRGIYTGSKNCKTFEQTIKQASFWALYWNAPIKLCLKCLNNWQDK